MDGPKYWWLTLVILEDKIFVASPALMIIAICHMGHSSQPQHLFVENDFFAIFNLLAFLQIKTDPSEILDLEN